MNTRPSDSAIAQAFWEQLSKTKPWDSKGVYKEIEDRAREIGAEQPEQDADLSTEHARVLQDIPKPDDPAERAKLYHAANRLMQVIGEEGEVGSRHAAVSDVMNALRAIDGGQYSPPAERAEDVEALARLAVNELVSRGGDQTIAQELDRALLRRLAAKPQPAWHEIEQMCMVTEAVTPDPSDIRGTLDRLIDYHVALNKTQAMEAEPNDDSGSEVAAAHGIPVYEIDFGDEGKGRYVRLRDFNWLVTDLAGKPPRSHGVVVDEAMVERAVEVFLANTGQAHKVTELQRELTTTCMRPALVAAIGEGES